MYFAEYGKRISFYGNIQYGAAPLPIKNYGGWPKDRVVLQPVPDPAYEEEEIEWVDPAIAENIAIIKRLKSQIDAEQSLSVKNALREQMNQARFEKEQAFRHASRRRKEEELSFILFN